jgi:ankyrin repeat protein
MPDIGTDFKNKYSSNNTMEEIDVFTMMNSLTDYRLALRNAITSGNTMEAKEIIRMLSAVDDDEGSRSLCLAIENNNKELVEWLVKAGIDPNGYNERDEVQLTTAAKKGDLEIVKILTEAGGDPNDCDDYGFDSPLHYAAMEGHIGILDYFLKNAGGELYLFDNDGHTLLSIASGYGNLNLVKYLIEKAGYNPNMRDGVSVGDRFLANPLLWAFRSNNSDVIDYLVEKIDIDEKDANGDTILMVAVKELNFYMVKNIISKGADVKCRDSEGRNALHIAMFAKENIDDLSAKEIQMIDYLKGVIPIEFWI